MTTATQKIPSGYKQTEIGVIPADWDVIRLGTESDLITKGTTPTSVGHNFQESGINFIKIESLEESGKIKLDKVAFIDKETNLLLKRSQLCDGDLLFSIAGALGRVALVNKDILPANTNQALAIIRLKKDSIFDINYIFYFLNSAKIKKHFDAMSVQGAQINLSLQNIYDLPIEYPKLKSKQTAIATTLLDADTLIEKLEKLIEKKKNIKQGTMQKLLTGKQRMPGFNNKWETKRLADVGEVITGSTPPTQIKEYWNGLIPWITPTDISDKKDIYNSEREISFAGLQVIRKLSANTLLVTCIASIGKNAILRTNGACNQQINAITPNKDHDVDFLYYLIENSKKYLLGNAGITATLMISKKDFSEITFCLPDKPEQVAIATVLSDMDTEIEKLESQLTKYQNIKQGMMQTLLTGKIRLLTK